MTEVWLSIRSQKFPRVVRESKNQCFLKDFPKNFLRSFLKTCASKWVEQSTNDPKQTLAGLIKLPLALGENGKHCVRTPQTYNIGL